MAAKKILMPVGDLAEGRAAMVRSRMPGMPGPGIAP